MRDLATNIPRLVRSGSSSSSPGDLSSAKRDADDVVLPREDIQAPDVTYHRGTVQPSNLSFFLAQHPVPVPRCRFGFGRLSFQRPFRAGSNGR